MSKHKTYNHSGIPALYEVVKGQVVSVQSYGAFVKIPSCQYQGLVHKSQISKSHVDDLSDIVSVGDSVYCKVIDIKDDGDRKKIALSVKLVNQTTGADTDPNNVELSLDQTRKRKLGKREFEKIELGAVLDTVCHKCGCKGHLAQECFAAGSGKKYELIPEIDESLFLPSTSDIVQTEDSTLRNHHKKDHKDRDGQGHKNRDHHGHKNRDHHGHKDKVRHGHKDKVCHGHKDKDRHGHKKKKHKC